MRDTSSALSCAVPRAVLTAVLLPAAFAATSLPARRVGAQSDAPTLMVIVTDQTTKEPIVGAQVGLRVSRYGGLTDSLGIVFLQGLPVGHDTLIVRMLGYAGSSTPVTLREGTTTEAMFALRKEAAPLPTVTVRGQSRRSPGPGFDDRKRMGFGHFVTRDEIVRRAPTRSSDILRTVPGVQLQPSRGGGYTVRMTRSTSRCRVQYYLDNLPINNDELIDAAIERRSVMDVQASGSAQARARARRLNRDIPTFHIDQINPDDIEAIEVYRGPAEIPAQYNRSGSICGVILIWTRTGK